MAEIARNYFEVRGRQQQLAVAERSLANQRETLRLAEVRRDAGFGEEQDVASAAARVAAIEASIPPIRSRLAQREHRLAVLIGDAARADSASICRRARIRRSPRRSRWVSRTACCAVGRISAPPSVNSPRRPRAKASWRRISIRGSRVTGFLGLLAGRGSLFDVADSRAYAITPALSWAAFDIGSVRDAAARRRGGHARIGGGLRAGRAARARGNGERAGRVSRDAAAVGAADDQARESARAADIARVRYREGAVDFLALLDAERTQLQAEDAVAQAESTVQRRAYLSSMESASGGGAIVALAKLVSPTLAAKPYPPSLAPNLAHLGREIP